MAYGFKAEAAEYLEIPIVESDLEEAIGIFINSAECVLYVAEDCGKAIGMMLVVCMPTWFNKLTSVANEVVWYVLPDYRKTGIGEALFDTMYDHLKGMSVDLYIVGAQAEHERTRNFYRLQGFREKETAFYKYIAEGNDDVYGD